MSTEHRDILWGSERDVSVDQLARRIKQLETGTEKAAGVQLTKAASAPPPPRISNVTTANGAFRFTWKAVDHELVAGYNIYRSNQGTNSAIAEFVCSVPQPSNLTAILKYDSATDETATLYYWVCSHNRSGTESVRVRAIAGVIYGQDSVIPGALVGLDMTKSGDGNFIATWSDPLTGYNSLDLFAVEWSTSKTSWTAAKGTLINAYARTFNYTEENVQYYFRFAAHNKSGKSSHVDGPGAALSQDGWGPWVYSGNVLVMGSATFIWSGRIFGDTTDTACPSGANGLVIWTNESDQNIPAGTVQFRFNRDTSNFDSIYAVEIKLHTGSIGEGPYSDERAAYPAQTIETGTCTIVAGSKEVTVTRASNPSIVGKVLITYTSDSDIDGNVIAAQGLNSLTTDQKFLHSGTFSYAIVEPWWATTSSNAIVYAFNFPDDFETERAETEWRTKPRPTLGGYYYATGYSRNYFGLGTKMTYSQTRLWPLGEETSDTGNPSGCGPLAYIITHADDATIPENCMAFRFTRDTSNWDSIFAVEVVLSTDPVTYGYGPYAAQRAAHPGNTRGTGTGATIYQDNKVVFITPPAGTAAGDVFLIYNTGDSGLDGNRIYSLTGSYIVMDESFNKSGTFNWAIVKPWWEYNSYEWTFWLPQDMKVSGVNATWQTKAVPLIEGTWIANVYTRNKFGLSVG